MRLGRPAAASFQHLAMHFAFNRFNPEIEQNMPMLPMDSATRKKIVQIDPAPQKWIRVSGHDPRGKSGFGMIRYWAAPLRRQIPDRSAPQVCSRRCCGYWIARVH
jgi:hypothetical protein